MYKLLIVDDEPFIREGLSKLICWDELGLEVAALASNGEDALLYLVHEKVDILITDIKMPCMDGVTLMHRCHQLGYNHMKYIVLSGYTDFELVKKAVQMGIENYLAKPVDKDELCQTLLQVIEKLNSEMTQSSILQNGISVIRDNLIYRWMTGCISHNELMERKEYLGFEFGKNNMVAIIDIHYIKGVNCITEDVTVQLEDAMLQIGAYIRSFNHGIVLTLNFGTVYVIFSNAKGRERSICQILGRIAFLIQEKGIFTYQIAKGNIEENMMMISKSYHNAQFALKANLIHSIDKIISYEEVESEMKQIPKPHLEMMSALEDLFKKDDQNEICQIIDTLLDNLEKTEGAKIELIQVYAVIIVTKIYCNIRNYVANSDEILTKFQNENTKLVYSMYYVDEIVQWTKEMAIKGLNITDQVKEKYSDIISRVFQYSEQNYKKPICIKTVANRFNMNPLYLGRIFKIEVGMAFTDYLNALRLKQAKSLLSSTDMTIKQIAEEIGYQNSNYFCTVFKKRVGSSPKEFKKNIQNNKILFGGKNTLNDTCFPTITPNNPYKLP